MNLYNFYTQMIVRGLNWDPETVLLGDFDPSRKADTLHHKRGEAYAFAFGVWNDFPGNPIYANEQAWDCVLHLFDRVCEWMHEDGTWDWYLPTTLKTHTINYTWSVYYWLRLLADFGDRIGASRRERIEQMSQLSW